MAKLIIFVTGKPLLYGHHRGDFKWSELHQCYTYLGREFEDTEFNQHVERALKTFCEMNPSVKVVQFCAPREKVELVREMTAQEAEDLLRRVAPERLRGKPGPKARLIVSEV